MSRTYETKGKIVKFLEEGRQTPTTIARQMGLNPSTISQHMRELVEIGLVQEQSDEHLKNIKYYSITNYDAHQADSKMVEIRSYA